MLLVIHFFLLNIKFQHKKCWLIAINLGFGICLMDVCDMYSILPCGTKFPYKDFNRPHPTMLAHPLQANLRQKIPNFDKLEIYLNIKHLIRTF